MRRTKTKVNNSITCWLDEFNSIKDFKDYIDNSDLNPLFNGKESSVKGTEQFTKTKSYKEATDLLKNGWDYGSNILTDKTKTINVKGEQRIRKMVNDIVGFQPIVPLYLAGAPMNMVKQVTVPKRTKIINIVKSITYSSFVSTDTIINESVLALKLVMALESQGYKVNLYIANIMKETNYWMCNKIKIKDASERLNISKLAFPLVHPSMLRRLVFRWLERNPNTTKSFVFGYGSPANQNEMKLIYKDAYIIPSIWGIKMEDIDQMESIDELFSKN